MTRPVSRAIYEDRLARVIDYIHDHLDEELDLDAIADIAAMSRWHWHRTYRAIQGETVAATVKRLRLQRAANDLANTELSIEEVAKRCGYANVQSFTRTFAASYGMPPARYRREGSHARFAVAISLGDTSMFPVEVKPIQAMKLVGIEAQGSYMNTGQVYERLFGALASADLVPSAPRMLAIYYDDPDSVPEAELRSLPGIVFDDLPAQLPEPLVAHEIVAGDHAVMEYTGPYADMLPAYRWLFGEWLVSSGREVAESPTYEIYLNSPVDTPPTKLRTDIYLPLKAG